MAQVMSQPEEELLSSWQMLFRKKRYWDAINSLEYICHARAGSSLNDLAWRIYKTHYDADWNLEESRVSENFNCSIPDILTVAGYTYI